ncbi:ethanolamine-phosphate phospho-lyase [Nannochloropsis oceanica]
MFQILDCVNNVAHVGHSHPKLALIAANQLNLINTNTRYLHPTRVRYAKKLLETFPVGSFLREEGKVFFVNSGSEANDLALRMARVYGGIKEGREAGRDDPDLREGTERRADGKGGGVSEGGREGGAMETIVLAGAYHGHTASLIEVSPYKYEGKGGFDPPGYIHKISAPDVYRGKYRCLAWGKAACAAGGCTSVSVAGGAAGGDALLGAGNGTDGAKDCITAAAAIGKQYAEEVKQICLSLRLQNKRMGAFIAESILGCGGQVVLPPSFLMHCYEYVREAGGVCIADEVQVGFGRVGTHFWGFETQDVCPDIVTMGKPMGNGFPLGAVVARREIADAFAGSGMEYFNTFGGSNLSCAIGEAVLDIIHQERLQENALITGAYLKEQLRERLLVPWPSVIGDVRGLGLFLGVECIEGTEEKEEEEEAREEGDNKKGWEDEVPIPSSEAAGWIAAWARGEGVQVSVDGPAANVLKIKPPLCFGIEEADLLVATLEKAVGEYTLMQRKRRGKEGGRET